MLRALSNILFIGTILLYSTPVVTERSKLLILQFVHSFIFNKCGKYFVCIVEIESKAHLQQQDGL